MKKIDRSKFFLGTVCLLLLPLILLLSSCQTAATPAATALPAPPTDAGLSVLFAGESCEYSGPKQATSGLHTLKISNQDKAHNAYAVALLSLKEGKTIDDLKAWTSTDQPSWSELVSYREIKAGENVSYEAQLKQGQSFIVCFSRPPEKYIGPVAAIEIQP